MLSGVNRPDVVGILERVDQAVLLALYERHQLVQRAEGQLGRTGCRKDTRQLRFVQFEDEIGPCDHPTVR